MRCKHRACSRDDACASLFVLPAGLAADARIRFTQKSSPFHIAVDGVKLDLRIESIELGSTVVHRSYVAGGEGWE